MIRVISTFLVSTMLLSAASNYEACGENKDLAKANLAQQISSNIQSSFTSNENVSSSFFSQSSKEVAYTISSSSSLTLSNVAFSQKGKETCAKITKKQLITLAKGKIKTVKKISLKNLPKDELKVINLLEGYLNDTNQAMAIASLHSKAFTDKEFALLHKLKKKILNERTKYHAQKISFDITPAQATLFIDGKKQNRHHNISLTPGKHLFRLSMENYQDYTQDFELQPKQARTLSIDLAGNRHPQIYFALSNGAQIKINNKTIKTNTFEFIQPGEHRYKVSMNGFCPAIGDVSLELGQTKTVHIDNASLTYPALTISSNQEMAELKINGEAFELGKIRTFHTCEDRDISYAVTFEGETQTQTATLSPGVQHTINVDFLTKSDKVKLLAQAKSYRDKRRFTLFNSYAIFDDKTITQYGLDIPNHKNWLRYGYGGSYGKDETDTVANVYYSIAFQLTEVGSGQLPLHIGSFALIPFIGTQAGISYQTFSEDTYGFTTELSLGTSFVFNQDLAFELSLHKNFIYEKEFTISFGLSLRDPF